MSVEVADLISLANKLKGDSEEVAWRASCGRSYYAGFHACLEVAAKRGFTRPTDARVHEDLLRFLEGFQSLQKSEMNMLRSIAKHLRQGRFLRTRADYELQHDFPVARAYEASNFVAMIMAQIARL
jgi:uncharacterized protein (UPF0332 family)